MTVPDASVAKEKEGREEDYFSATIEVE